MSNDNTRPLIVGQEVPATPYPVKMKGEVIKGFGRGSKELGIPTANLPETSFEEICKCMEPGIYYGWAQVIFNDNDNNDDDDKINNSNISNDNNNVYPMVMSLGWNPYYRNEKRSAEVHIMHEFPEEFYGKELRVIVLGYIRPERDYNSVDSLIQDINFDIKVAENSLARDSYVSYKNDSFFMDIKTSIKRT